MAKQIEFIDYQRPALDPGIYTFDVTQTVSLNQKQVEEYSQIQTLSVTRPGFGLLPQDIAAVFPPEGSQEDHSNVLPHISFTRSSLPWERVEKNSPTPWLMLLLFTEEEMADKQQMEQCEIKSDQQPKIKVNKTLLAKLIPQDSTELELLAHVRQPVLFTALLSDYKNILQQKSFDKIKEKFAQEKINLIANMIEVLELSPERWVVFDKAGGLEYHMHAEGNNIKVFQPKDGRALIMGNRLPASNMMHTVYLVSLVGIYNGEKFTLKEDMIELAYFKKWQFGCKKTDKPEERRGFEKILTKVDVQPLFIDVSEHPKKKMSQSFYDSGNVPLVHYLRSGAKTVSWYRGPLIPGANKNSELLLPAQTADSLLQFNPDIGMFDVSYAAAWELGRLLMLQNKDIAKQLYRWKRDNLQKQKQSKAQIKHLLIKQNYAQLKEESKQEVPAAVLAFLADMALLKGVPFNYLVPAKEMLPAESIRFFQVDTHWIRCLLDGALSIGRTTNADYEMDKNMIQLILDNLYNRIDNNTDQSLKTARLNFKGFLLRSDAVAGWPTLTADGYFEIEKDKLLLQRIERLSPNVLFCLFREKENALQTIDIHLKPEGIHFGFSVNEHNEFVKDLRDEHGHKINKSIELKNYWKESNKNIIDIKSLASTITAKHSSSQFALQMIEGIAKVRFTVPNINA